MHLMKHADTLALRGEGRLYRVDYTKIPDAPCRGLEHRHGICPLSIDHRVEEFVRHNTILSSLKGSITNQLAGDSALDLAITMIACGTSAIATTSCRRRSW